MSIDFKLNLWYYGDFFWKLIRQRVTEIRFLLIDYNFLFVVIGFIGFLLSLFSFNFCIFWHSVCIWTYVCIYMYTRVLYIGYFVLIISWNQCRWIFLQHAYELYVQMPMNVLLNILRIVPSSARIRSANTFICLVSVRYNFSFFTFSLLFFNYLYIYIHANLVLLTPPTHICTRVHTHT